MTKDEFYENITRELIAVDGPDEDVLLFMVLLHLYEIHLKPDVKLEDVKRNGGGSILAALTRYGVAGLAALVWPPDSEKAQESYWYAQYSRETPFETLADIPATTRSRLTGLRERLASHPLIEAVVYEG